MDTGVWLDGLLAGVRFGVSDSRDKIYGIVGLLEEKSKLLDLEAPHSEDTQGRSTFTERIDYAKSEIEVYQDITKFLINRDRNLLPLCIFRNRTIAADGLPGWVINCNPAARSWHVATHLTASSELVLQLQEHFMQGAYGEAEMVGSIANGSLKLNGHRICRLTTFEGREEDSLSHDVRIKNSLVTSPPIPDRGFHTFIKDYEMLLKECAYKELGLGWLHEINEEMFTRQDGRLPGSAPESTLQLATLPRAYLSFPAPKPAALPRSALVSQAAGPAAFLVLVDGCPLPLVMQKADQSTSQHTFLGPAAWSIESATPSDAPGYSVTKSLRDLAQKESWEKEEFCLV